MVFARARAAGADARRHVGGQAAAHRASRRRHAGRWSSARSRRPRSTSSRTRSRRSTGEDATALKQRHREEVGRGARGLEPDLDARARERRRLRALRHRSHARSPTSSSSAPAASSAASHADRGRRSRSPRQADRRRRSRSSPRTGKPAANKELATKAPETEQDAPHADEADETTACGRRAMKPRPAVDGRARWRRRAAVDRGAPRRVERPRGRGARWRRAPAAATAAAHETRVHASPPPTRAPRERRAVAPRISRDGATARSVARRQRRRSAQRADREAWPPPRCSAGRSPASSPRSSALLRGNAVDAALAKARDWHAREPGDVLALIGLGDALEAQAAARHARRASTARSSTCSRAAPTCAGSPASGSSASAAHAHVADRRHLSPRGRGSPRSLTGHRLLAYALVRAGKPAEAFAAILAGVDQTYPRRQLRRRRARAARGRRR